MIKINEQEFFKIQSSFGNIPFSQSKDWCKYLISKGDKVVYYYNSDSEASIAFMGREKKIHPFGKLLLIEGELISDNISNEIITEFYKNLIKLPYAGIEMYSNNEYSFEYEIGIRRAGFLRPLTTHSSSLSMIINLSNTLSFSRNWKKNYKKAIKSELVFEEHSSPDIHILQSFSDIYSEMSARQKLGYKLNTKDLAALMSQENMRFFLIKNIHDIILACRIVYVYGTHSYDVFAANSIQSRNNGASNFLVQSILEKLASEGILTFDFARLPPSTRSIDGVYLFKKSIQGRNVLYNGEWAYYKNNFFEYIMQLGRKLISNQQRY